VAQRRQLGHQGNKLIEKKFTANHIIQQAVESTRARRSESIGQIRSFLVLTSDLFTARVASENGRYIFFHKAYDKVPYEEGYNFSFCYGC